MFPRLRLRGEIGRDDGRGTKLGYLLFFRKRYKLLKCHKKQPSILFSFHAKLPIHVSVRVFFQYFVSAKSKVDLGPSKNKVKSIIITILCISYSSYKYIRLAKKNINIKTLWLEKVLCTIFRCRFTTYYKQQQQK